MINNMDCDDFIDTVDAFDESLDDFLERETNDEILHYNLFSNNTNNSTITCDSIDEMISQQSEFNPDYERMKNYYENDDDSDNENSSSYHNDKSQYVTLYSYNKNDMSDPYTFSMKDVLQFPMNYVRCLNSGDYKNFKTTIESIFHPSCSVKLCFPYKELNYIGPEVIIKAFENLSTTYPDGLLHIKNVKYTRSNNIRVIKTKTLFVGTKTNDTYDEFVGLQPGSLLEYMDMSQLSDQNKYEISKIQSNKFMTKRYYKRSGKAYVDEHTNLILAIEIKISLIGFEVINSTT